MLELRNLQLSYDQNSVLHNIDLDVYRGEILCLLGPSGCGKTSLLRTIAGLEKVNQGTVTFDGQDITLLPTHSRNFGLMFQDFALFPHLSVGKNVDFGLKMNGDGARQRTARIQEMLRLVGLQDFINRDVAQLSGGEKQRVALARSLAPRPRLLMLDEPLGALDANLRKKLITDIRSIIKELGLTAIYVTHDREEAFTIADRIAIMQSGTIVQLAEPRDLYERPATLFVAKFLGLENIIPVSQYSKGYLMTAIGDFPATEFADFVLIHPNNIEVVADVDTNSGIVGTVVECIYLGDQYQISVKYGSGTKLSFKLSSVSQFIPVAGQDVRLLFAKDRIVPLLNN